MPVKKSWNDKLQGGKPPLVKRLDKNIAGMQAGQQMLVPSAQLIDDYIHGIARGKSQSVLELRAALAQQFQADVTCPIATGFAIKIVAEAAFERLNQGDDWSTITPIWRVLDQQSPTLQKVSFDPQMVLRQRQIEGLSS